MSTAVIVNSPAAMPAAAMPAALSRPATRAALSLVPACSFMLTRHQNCPNSVRWRIDTKHYCHKHADEFWESHYVEDHQVLRLMRDDWKGRSDRDLEPASEPSSPSASLDIALIHQTV